MVVRTWPDERKTSSTDLFTRRCSRCICMEKRFMISAVILTKNEENNIVDCIESLTWVDEIIVIDDNSDDRTAALAKTKGATVYTHSLNNDFSKQRNFGLEKAKGNWILFIDADERVSEDLKKEIKHIVRSSLVYEGYFIKRKDILWGNEIKHGENAHIPILRLAKKESGTWVGKVHETWEVHGKISVLQNELHHYTHQSMYE